MAVGEDGGGVVHEVEGHAERGIGGDGVGVVVADGGMRRGSGQSLGHAVGEAQGFVGMDDWLAD